MTLRASIGSIIEDFDQHDEQDVENVRLVMIDCQNCEYRDTFKNVEQAELYLHGHRLVSNHWNIDIGVELDMMMHTIDTTIRVGDTIE